MSRGPAGCHRGSNRTAQGRVSVQFAPLQLSGEGDDRRDGRAVRLDCAQHAHPKLAPHLRSVHHFFPALPRAIPRTGPLAEDDLEPVGGRVVRREQEQFCRR
eukprot:2278227-Pyramimonas_sp.AAC.1